MMKELKKYQALQKHLQELPARNHATLQKLAKTNKAIEIVGPGPSPTPGASGLALSDNAKDIDFKSTAALQRITKVVSNINEGNILLPEMKALNAKAEFHNGQCVVKEKGRTSQIKLRQNGLDIDSITPLSAKIAVTLFVCNLLQTDTLPPPAKLKARLGNFKVKISGDDKANAILAKAYKDLTGIDLGMQAKPKPPFQLPPQKGASSARPKR